MGFWIRQHKNFVFKAAIAVIVLVACYVLLNDTGILQRTYDNNRPEKGEDLVNAELVLAYKDQSREAVEEHFGEKVTDDYLTCEIKSWADAGIYYYCNIDGAYYRFKVDAGSWISTIDYIVYNANEAPDPGMDEFDFVLEEGWLGLITFSKIVDA